MMPDPDAERHQREDEEDARVRREVEEVWQRTADALRRLALLEIETAVFTRDTR